MAFKSLLLAVSLVSAVLAAPPTPNSHGGGSGGGNGGSHGGSSGALVTCPDGNQVSNSACCPLFALRDDLLNNLFINECGELTHEALRLTFHDAVGFSQELAAAGVNSGGGADGSFIVFPNVEPNFFANLGTSDSVDALIPFLQRHPFISAGDLIQFAGAVAITNCAGAPRLEFLLGRPNATAPAPEGLVPEPQDALETRIFPRMMDAGNFSPQDVVALLASHTIARSDHVDPALAAVPFDSTPFTFDTQVFVEVLLKGTGFPGTPNNQGEVMSPLPVSDGLNVGEMRLQSDFLIARHPLTACTWQSFVNENAKMSAAFKEVMARLAVIGQDKSKLIDCSDVIPVPKPATTGAFLPATKTMADIEQACQNSPFPSLTALPGNQETIIPHCISTDTACLATVTGNLA